MKFTLFLAVVAVTGCDKRCTSELDSPDSIAVQVDTSGAVPSFSWDGDALAMLDVWLDEGAGTIDTGMAVVGDPTSPKSGQTLMWRVQCDYVSFQKRSAIRQNCIQSPVSFGQVPDDADEDIAAVQLTPDVTYTVKAHRYPMVDAESCYAYADGTVNFAVAEE